MKKSGFIALVYNTARVRILPGTDKPHQPMSTIRVLTLGWEFPPLVNGGWHCLPGSFQGAGKKSGFKGDRSQGRSFRPFDGFQLTGLNNVSYREVEQVDRKYSYDSFALVERAPIELDPYTTVEGGSGVVQFTKEGRITFYQNA